MFNYPAIIERDGDTYMVSFPDFPGVFSQGDTAEDAALHAVDALETALELAVESGSIPEPSVSRPKTRIISVSVSFAAKLLLVQELKTQNLRPAELSRRLQMMPQEVTRLIDLRHTSKIDAVANAFKALGKTLEVSCR